MLRFDSPQLLLDGEDEIFRGLPLPLAAPPFVGGCHYLGRLCVVCRTDEIELYHQRLMADDRYAGGSAATVAEVKRKAASICKCEADLNKNACYGHRYQLLQKIKAKCEENTDWLERITLLPGQNSAIYNQTLANSTLTQTNRINTNSEILPCRCGRDIVVPPPGAAVRTNAVPPPVAMCMACSGVRIDIGHHMVLIYVLPGRTNMNLRPRAAPGNVVLPVLKEKKYEAGASHAATMRG